MKSKYLSWILAVLVLAPTTVLAADEHASPARGLFFQSLNLGILIVVLYFLLRKPAREFLLTRTAKIRGDISGARTEREEMERKLAETRRFLENFDREMAELRDQMTKDSMSLKLTIVATANESGAKMVTSATENTKHLFENERHDLIVSTFEKAREIAVERIRSRAVGLTEADLSQI